MSIAYLTPKSNYLDQIRTVDQRIFLNCPGKPHTISYLGHRVAFNFQISFNSTQAFLASSSHDRKYLSLCKSVKTKIPVPKPRGRLFFGSHCYSPAAPKAIAITTTLRNSTAFQVRNILLGDLLCLFVCLFFWGFFWGGMCLCSIIRHSNQWSIRSSYLFQARRSFYLRCRKRDVMQKQEWIQISHECTVRQQREHNWQITKNMPVM